MIASRSVILGWSDSGDMTGGRSRYVGRSLFLEKVAIFPATSSKQVGCLAMDTTSVL